MKHLFSGAGEMAQQLRAPIALSEDLGLIAGMNTVINNCLYAQLEGIQWFSAGTRHTWGTQTYTQQSILGEWNLLLTKFKANGLTKFSKSKPCFSYYRTEIYIIPQKVSHTETGLYRNLNLSKSMTQLKTMNKFLKLKRSWKYKSEKVHQ